MSRRSGWAGADTDLEAEVDNRNHEQAQIEAIRNAAIAEKERGKRAIEQLADLRIQILDVETRLYRMQVDLQREGEHAAGEAVGRIKWMLRQVRDGRPIQDLFIDLSYWK